MVERKSIPKSLRFEVFKRDSFKCQYCGASAPDVILEIDHILPVAEGGKNDILNLVTSCKDCNRGKGKKKLTDKQTIERQKLELDVLNQKREQLEMMMLWKRELLELQEKAVNEIDYLISSISDWSISDFGKKKIRILLNNYSFDEIYEATKISYQKYYNGSEESWNVAFDKIGGVCYNKKIGRTVKFYAK